jgi:S-(hydroxymethyl)glutathione dehydrogenase/alcohol dehydrogenase
VKAAVVDVVGGGFAVHDVDIAEPVGREVLVDVRASGLCHTDLTLAAHPLPGYEPPVVLGHEIAGVVTALGPQASDFGVGDHVVGCLVQWCGGCPACLDGRPYQCGNPGATTRDPQHGPRLARAGLPLTQGMGLGGFAQQVLVHEHQLTAVPREVPFAPAALLGCGVLTGVGSVLTAARVRAGESVAVIGVGGVGLNAVAAAGIAGASRIVAVDVQDGRLGRARAFGATDAVDSRAVDAAEAVRELTGGGVDHAFDMVGTAATTEQALAMTALGGAVYVVGLAMSGGELRLSLPQLLLQQKRVQGVIMGSGNPRRDIPRHADLYLRGRLNLDDLVSHRIALEEIDAGYAALKDPGTARVVITSF